MKGHISEGERNGSADDSYFELKPEIEADIGLVPVINSQVKIELGNKIKIELGSSQKLLENDARVKLECEIEDQNLCDVDTFARDVTVKEDHDLHERGEVHVTCVNYVAKKEDWDLKPELIEEVSMCHQLLNIKDLYTGHIVKKELVVGPEILQQPCMSSLEEVEKNSFAKTADLFPQNRPHNTNFHRIKENYNETCTSTENNYCHLCHKYYGNNQALKDHIQLHTGHEFYVCDICNKLFTIKTVLRTHMLEHIDDKSVLRACQISSETFTNSNLLGAHGRTHKQKTEAKYLRSHTEKSCKTCDICKQTFSSTSEFCAHIQSPSTKRPYNCDICNKSFKRRDNLRSHMRRHLDGKPYNCDFCNKKFLDNRSLRTHMCKYSGNLIKDDASVEQFSHINSLSAKITHTKEKYTCDVCKKVYLHKGVLRTHMRVHSANEQFNCDKCYKVFAVASHLERHKLTHTGEKPFKCSLCEKGFTQNSTLIRHMQTHSVGEHTTKKLSQPESGKCHICNKILSRKSDLHEHLRTHTGDKPYKCSICNLAFARNTNLNSHIRTHSGVKPYKCDICDKAFSRNESLRKHMPKHTGEKPYSCNICDAVFMRNECLRQHLNRHLRTQYSCDICSKNFTSSSYFRNHKRLKHPSDDES